MDAVKASQQEGSQAESMAPHSAINGRRMNGAQPASEMESVIDEEWPARTSAPHQ
jgi:hypothetical protein